MRLEDSSHGLGMARHEGKAKSGTVARKEDMCTTGEAVLNGCGACLAGGAVLDSCCQVQGMQGGSMQLQAVMCTA